MWHMRTASSVPDPCFAPRSRYSPARAGCLRLTPLPARVQPQAWREERTLAPVARHEGGSRPVQAQSRVCSTVASASPMTRQPDAATSATSVVSRPRPPSAHASWSASATRRTAATSAATPAAKMMSRSCSAPTAEVPSSSYSAFNSPSFRSRPSVGRRPGRVGCHSDHAPVGEFLSTVLRKASSSLRNAAMSMSAAPRPGSDRRVYVLCDCHSGSLSNCDVPRRCPPREASGAPMSLSGGFVFVLAGAGCPR